MNVYLGTYLLLLYKYAAVAANAFWLRSTVGQTTTIVGKTKNEVLTP